MKEYEWIKNHARDLFEKSADQFPLGDTTPLWKSLFVIFLSQPRSIKKDQNLYFCYFAGLVDEKYVRKIVEYIEG